VKKEGPKGKQECEKVTKNKLEYSKEGDESENE
jgi:hypothetical protein